MRAAAVAVWIGATACGSPEPPEPAPGPTVATTAAPTAGANDGVDLYHLTWERVEAPREMRAGETARVNVTARNTSEATWPDPAMADPVVRGGAQAVRLGHRWWNATADAVVADYDARVDLVAPVPPGETVTLPVEVTAPAAPGTYQLQVDLVHELVAWFEGRGVPKQVVPVEVRPAG